MEWARQTTSITTNLQRPSTNTKSLEKPKRIINEEPEVCRIHRRPAANQTLDDLPLIHILLGTYE